MTNKITATINFSFKGETFSPSVEIDLDNFFSETQVLEPGIVPMSIYNMIAKNGDIDSYSYVYEVMLASDVSFSEACGLAAEHLSEGRFDFQGFEKDWKYQKKITIIQAIAQRHMHIEDIEQQPQLRDALMEALDSTV